MSRVYFDRVPVREVLSAGKKALKSAFGDIEEDWEKRLKKSGVKLPKDNTAKWYQLAVLKHFQGRAVHKDDIARLIEKLTGRAATDQQVRHLKTQGGWFVLNRGDSFKSGKNEMFNPEGCHVLITTKEPLPDSTLKRRRTVGRGDWERILEEYNHTCASCGTKVGERHRFDPSFKVEVLEKGHMNPAEPLEAGNIIPQCRWCNKTARGDFTFDEQGRPRAVASVRPVRRADDKVVRKIEEWIKDKNKRR